MTSLDYFLSEAASYAWGTPLLVLLIGGGLGLTLYSRLLPFRGLPQVLNILRGKYDSETDLGHITHFQALSTHLAATVGMGNIGGVAIAITQGGPGAVFWMWVAAIVGMGTKFFTCTLAVLYRGRDSLGQLQGGPMYYIEKGLGKRYRFLAVFFSLCGMVGCLSVFQTNQMAEVLVGTYSGSSLVQTLVQVSPVVVESEILIRFLTGITCLAMAALVILGGLKRIAKVASRFVPLMCLLYLIGALLIVLKNITQVPEIFYMIVTEAFTGHAAVGGATGMGVFAAMQWGIRRGAFSNEAGIGTAPMAHGAAKTNEPVREGLVAMVGPFVDTIIVCSMTAFVILSTGQWQNRGMQGVSLTAEAFAASLGEGGRSLLVLAVLLFGFSTIFGYSYYGKKCFGYLFGVENGRLYDYFYLVMLLVGAMWSARMVVNLADAAFALMAWPNMIAALVLAPKVMEKTRLYFRRYRLG